MRRGHRGVKRTRGGGGGGGGGDSILEPFCEVGLSDEKKYFERSLEQKQNK
jgi:hypothetical protein